MEEKTFTEILYKFLKEKNEKDTKNVLVDLFRIILDDENVLKLFSKFMLYSINDIASTELENITNMLFQLLIKSELFNNMFELEKDVNSSSIIFSTYNSGLFKISITKIK